MRLGIWCPAPQTIRQDAETRASFAALTQHGGGVDESFLYAADILKRAEELGFDISLIAQRYLGPDLDSWMFAAALAPLTRSIKLMAAGIGVNMSGISTQYNRLRTSTLAKPLGFRVVWTVRIPKIHLPGDWPD